MSEKVICSNCLYDNKRVDEEPCLSCKHCNAANNLNGAEDKFTPIFNNSIFTHSEEINHPDRYANGKYECIDVMVDVFGVEATKTFCKLNAFKYLWREERKNGLQDVKKTAWYINKYIELSESGDEENV